MSKIGILGGGQLGRMFIQNAISYGTEVNILENSKDCPSAHIASHFTLGDINNYEDVISFGEHNDIITIEIEHVNVDALEELERRGKKIFPQPNLLRLIKDKGLQKQFYLENDIPTSPFKLIESGKDLTTSDIPCVLKSRTGGYDGKGVQLIKDTSDLKNVFESPCLVEELVNFHKEISVIVARNENGEVKTFPVVDMEFNHEANLVEFLFSPAEIPSHIEEKAQVIAKETIDKMGLVGLLAVEMFWTKNDDVLVNEVAPRPHNSGHQTIEGNVTSQYDQHLRSIMNWPLGNTDITQPSVMLNLLGEKGHTGPVYYENLSEVLKIDGAHVHIYGKSETKPFRKMGHVTVTDSSLESAKVKAKKVQELLKVKTNNQK